MGHGKFEVNFKNALTFLKWLQEKHKYQNLTRACAGHPLQVKLSASNVSTPRPLTSTCRPCTFGIGCLGGFVSLHVGA
jgi:hypothetical protein